MKNFLDVDFLLDNPAAKHLYAKIEQLPIVDIHCHLDPREIAEDRVYDNITELWLGHDHYKWRAMRYHGVKEKLITGDGDPREKFRAYAETLQNCVGNPLYHWSHLELARYFNIFTPLNEHTCDDIYDSCNQLLRNGLSVKQIIQKSRVKVLCTTDDPCDSLSSHMQLQQENFSTLVLPSFRPDKALQIESDAFPDYIQRLSAVSGVFVNSFKTLCEALKNRLNYFCSLGCRVSDHALEKMVFEPASEELVSDAFHKAIQGEKVSSFEANAYKTSLLLYLARLYKSKKIIMQLHVGCMRNINTCMFNVLGADSGYDASLEFGDLRKLAMFLDEANRQNALPRMILYSLDENCSRSLMTICTAFNLDGDRASIQTGPPWWFNDTKSGMENQLRDYADLGCLAESVGMLTDSRSFLSFSRHEYYRRILCNFIGNLIEKGEYPADYNTAEKIARQISYLNALDYLGIDESTLLDFPV